MRASGHCSGFITGKVAERDIEHPRCVDGAAIVFCRIVRDGDARNQIDRRIAAVTENGAAGARCIAILQGQIHAGRRRPLASKRGAYP